MIGARDGHHDGNRGVERLLLLDLRRDVIDGEAGLLADLGQRADELTDVRLVRQLGQRLLQAGLEDVLLVLELREIVGDGLLLGELVLESVEDALLVLHLLVFRLHEEEVVGGADPADEEDQDADLLRERQLVEGGDRILRGEGHVEAPRPSSSRGR